MKKNRIILIILSLLTFAMGFFSFQRKVESWTPLGFYIEDKENGPTIVQVEAGSQAEEIGLKTKDIILEVNGLKGDSSLLKKILLSNKDGSKLLIFRNGNILSFNFLPPDEKIDTDYLVFSFVGGVFFIIGLITYFKDPAHLTFIFSLVMIFSFGLFVIYPSGKVNDLWRTLYAFRIIFSFLIFPLLINFFISFPKIILKKTNILWLIYLPGIVLSFLFIDAFLLEGKILLSEDKIPLLFKLKFFYFFIYSALLIAIFIFQWFRRKKQYLWKKWTWAISGTLGFLPYIFFEVVYQDLGFDSGIPLWALAVFMVLLPLSFSTAISGDKLENLSTYFLNTFYFLLTLFFGLFLYILFNTFLLKIFQEKLKASQNFILFLSGFLIALFLYLYRMKLYVILDKISGTKRIEIQEKISEFLQNIAFYKNPEKLLTDLFSLLRENFSLNYVNFYYYKEGKWSLFLIDDILPQSIEGEELSAIKTKNILPLLIKKDKIGALILGEKEGNLPLSQWEISTIKNILTTLSFYFQNLILLNELEKKYEELSYSENFLETIFSHSPLGLLVVNSEGEVIKCNPSSKEILNISEGINFFKILPKMKNLIFQGEIINLNTKTLLLTQAFFPTKSKENNYIIFINDLTEKVSLQEALKEKEKMAVLGQFASTIAHELNTPLTAICSYAQILLKKFPEDSIEYKKFSYIYRESFHMSQLINSLLEFSKSQKMNLIPCSIKEVIKNALSILDPILEEKKFKIEIKEDADFYINSDPVLLQQALFNIIKNGCEAVNYNGKVSLSYFKKSEKIEILVEDSGPGIEEEAKEKIFEPFFSTKMGRGTGLGLTIANSIIKSMGGKLFFEKRKERGTIVHLEIPYEDFNY